MKNKISIDAVVSRKENILDCIIDNEMVLMSIDTGQYINLNKQASAIWSLLESPKVVSNIVEEMQQLFLVEHKECETDVLSFIEKLKGEKLIVLG
ncbi:PqqD family peptide modification chaperone [Aliikangiella sp. IMCC44359]|uniref:PqqD family peptide modification chaperone n=1 Tax=Aliikangiella sp. IMCC44359 TaxID=3459125 RepID=UPI00403B2149